MLGQSGAWEAAEIEVRPTHTHHHGNGTKTVCCDCQEPTRSDGSPLKKYGDPDYDPRLDEGLEWRYYNAGPDLGWGMVALLLVLGFGVVVKLVMIGWLGK